MKVVLLGATGFTGEKVLEELIQQGHQISVLVRNASKINIQHKNLNIIQGNIFDEKLITELLSNQEAVINCLGIGGKGKGKPNSFVSDATKFIIPIMEKQQVNRLIAMSNVGAGESMNYYPWFFRQLILPYFLKWLLHIIEDKNRMESIIKNSQLDWTIARFPNIVDLPAKNKHMATLNGKRLKMSITNSDAAIFLVNQLTNRAFIHQIPSISN